MLLNEDEWASLASTLAALTTKRRVPWIEEEVADENGEPTSVYRSEVNKTTYHVGSVDGDGVAPFFLDIYRGGSLFDSIQSPMGRNSEASSSSLRVQLRDLHREIGRYIHRAPERVLELLEDLEALHEEKPTTP